MDLEQPPAAKQFQQVGDAQVAYLDLGEGPPVLLLHGCPFSSFVWRKVIARLRHRYRCIAPDLLGLGDTHTPPEADWSLPAQTAMVIGLLDALGLAQVAVVGHDHGGAIAQLLAVHHPERVSRLILANAEAYDNWPSAAERPFIRATQLPVLGRVVLWAWSQRPLLKWALTSGKAVADPNVLTRELLEGYRRANLADRRRRAKTRRFLAGQLDPTNQHATMDAAAGLGRFTKPVLIVWGQADPHFGPVWADRLAGDLPGASGPVLLERTGHLLMEERPEELASHIDTFLTNSPGSNPRPEPGR